MKILCGCINYEMILVGAVAVLIVGCILRLTFTLT